MKRDMGVCQLFGPDCRVEATEVDHIVGAAEGGTDTAENGQAVCRPCHQAKTREERILGKARARGIL